MKLDVIYNEDCLVGMRRIPDHSVDMILCDLPYGTTACKWDSVISFEPLWGQYKRVAKKNAAIVLTASQPFTTTLAASNIRDLKYSLVWEKGKATGFLDCRFRPLKAHEDILVFSSGGCANGSRHPMRYHPQGLVPSDKPWTKKPVSGNVRTAATKIGVRREANYPRSVLKFSAEHSPTHNTQKPVPLFEYLIRTYTDEGEIVLDNCIGSGTTAIACINTSRHYIGFERDPKYFKIAQQRVASTLS